MMQVLAMTQTDSFVQQVTVGADRVPSVVLFTARQLRELRAFCFDARRGSVLSFDKTYNLGSMFVTVSTYQNLSVDRVTSGASPTFIGPLFIHGKSSTETYNVFFSSIASRLQYANFTELWVGSDDEYALRKSIQFCFPGSIHVACRRHLNTNAVHYAQDVVGMNRQQRNSFIQAVFGDAGVASCPDLASFDVKVAKLQQDLLSSLPEQMQHYFHNRLVPFLRDNIAAGCADWTNNGCESINHVLKSEVHWRPQKLPELIAKLRQLVDAQYVEADRAMLGRGDFVLKQQYAKHRLTVDEWQRMSDRQRDKARDQCFRLTAPTGTVTSSDGSVTVRGVPHGGRKPHQRKRPTAERSTTLVKRPKADFLPDDDDDFQ